MTVTNDPSGALSALQEALDHGDDRRSPLFRWMMQHYDLFSGMLVSAREAGSRPNWARLAKTFAQYGLSDAEGQPLKKHTVRLTWWRVRRARAKLGNPTVLAPAPPPPLRSALVRETVQASVTQAPVGRPVERVKDSNEALADVLAEMNKRSGRI